MVKHYHIILSILFCAGCFFFPTALFGEKILILESWRSEDIKAWENQILPVFYQDPKHQGIRIVFKPSERMAYNANMRTKLENGTAGDLISCRPFDISLRLYQKGYLTRINDIEGVQHFSQKAKHVWSTDNGKNLFCLPIASVIHGFIYNQDIFKTLKLSVPQTESAFFKTLKTIKQKSHYIPLVLGTADQWESNELVFQNIGPNYWKGENGRLRLIQGSSRFTDQAYLSLFQTMAALKDYTGPNIESQSYEDSKSIFKFGQGAILPMGSFDIQDLTQKIRFSVDAFPPPVRAKSDHCYISDHADIGIGINANSKSIKEARIFLKWMTTPEFANVFSNALPGFYSLSNHDIQIKNALAQTFLSWRKKCQTTHRNGYQILDRGKPSLIGDLTLKSAAVISGRLSPQKAVQDLQKGLNSWYQPKQP